jgi:hypothetical protein
MATKSPTRSGSRPPARPMEATGVAGPSKPGAVAID